MNGRLLAALVAALWTLPALAGGGIPLTLEVGAPVLGGKYTDSAAVAARIGSDAGWRATLGFVSSQTAPFHDPTQAEVLAILRGSFFSTAPSRHYAAAVDANGDGKINAQDLVSALRLDGTLRANAYAGIGYGWTHGPLVLDVGTAYWQRHSPVFNSKWTAQLGVAWRVLPSLEVGYRHWFAGGSLDRFAGQDAFVLGYKFGR